MNEAKRKSSDGMSKEIYSHICKHIHDLELDLKNGKILNRNAKSLKSGYPQIKLAGKTVYQHQVFAVVRWGEACIGMTVNHINEIRTDNSWNNLELMDFVQNVLIASKGGSAKQKVKAIHLDTGEILIFESQLEASIQLGLHACSITQVLKGTFRQTGRYTFEKLLA
jgi:hypothetical protein